MYNPLIEQFPEVMRGSKVELMMTYRQKSTTSFYN